MVPGLNVNLTLTIESTHHWPDNVVLNETDSIVDLHIMGAVNSLKLFNILSSMPDIRSRKIINSIGHLCRLMKNYDLFRGKTITLHLLKETHFDNFPECLSFYKQFVKYTGVKNPSIFRLSKSYVTQNSYVVIQNILKNV